MNVNENEAFFEIGTETSSAIQAIDKLSATLNNLTNTLNTSDKKTEKFKLNLSGISKALEFGTLYAIGKKAFSGLSKLTNLSSQYIETLNLFNVSMGELNGEATKFVNTFSNKLGIAPADVMRYTSTFYNLAQGFGIANDKAFIMSKNLTQLSYDTSSFLGLPIDQTVKKIKYGISGEFRSLKALNIALDRATLQETAYALGINRKVSEMTKAQKTELIYYQLIKNTTKIQGNMARTLKKIWGIIKKFIIENRAKSVKTKLICCEI